MNVINISIIIPAYNVDKFIVRTLESLQKQSYTKKLFEIIIINDGSKDSTQRVVEDFANNNKSMLIKIINQVNSGVSATRNRGMDESIGKYIIFLDGDDYVETEWLSSLYNKINNEKLDFVFCKKHTVDNNGKVLSYENDRIFFKNILHGKDVLYLQIADKINIHIGNFIFNKEVAVLNNIRFNKYYKYGEDLDFEMRLLLYCEKVMCIDKHLMSYVVHGNSVMQNSGRIDYLKNIRVFYNFKKFLETQSGNNKKNINIIANSRIPKTIVQILTRWSILEKDKLFESLLSRKFARKYLLRSVFNIFTDHKYVVKSLLLLYLKKTYRKKYNKKNYEHLYQ